MEANAYAGDVSEEELFEFILDQIDSVPHLEALLLLWNSRPRTCHESELARTLFIDTVAARSLIADLSRRGLVSPDAVSADSHRYLSSPQNDRMLDALAHAYRTQLIRISNTIHSKASAGVREFARAFQFKRKGGSKA